MTRKSGLGKGLEALIPGSEYPVDSGVIEISVHRISSNPRQPRSKLDPEKTAELAASIREHGVIQPLIVTRGKLPGEYVLIAGERRLLAAKQAGLEKIPALLREASDEETLELALVENVQRADLNPLEMAEAYRQLAEDFHFTHEQIAVKVAKSRVSVTNTLRLLKLPTSVKQAIADGSITEGHARALLSLPSAQSQAAVLESIQKKDLNVRQTEALVSKIVGSKERNIIKRVSNPETSHVQRQLEEALGTRVILKKHQNGGMISIHFFSDEELNALIDRLLGI